jgi:hypothetical protein
MPARKARKKVAMSSAESEYLLEPATTDVDEQSKLSGAASSLNDEKESPPAKNDRNSRYSLFLTMKQLCSY